MTAMSELYDALKSKAGVIPAENVKTNNQLRLLARLQPGKIDAWMAVAQRLKRAEFQSPWSIDISKLLFLKNNKPTGALVHGWRVILKSDKLDEAISDVAKLIKSAPNAHVELAEIDLPGGGVHRRISTTTGYKGVEFTSPSKESAPWMKR